MLIRNTQTRYGMVAIFLHWAIAVLIIALLLLGLYMVGLPINLQKLKLYGWHKETGIAVLLLVIVRLLWRVLNALPSLASLPNWERRAARCVHYTFYVCMIFMPLTGWMMSSAAGLPVSFFGLIVLPDLLAPDENLRILLVFIHKWLAYFMIALICLHIAASLKHYFIDKDDILQRILRP